MPATLHYHRSSDESDTARLVRDMMALDREIYGDIGEEHLGQFDYWCERLARCPDCLSVARKSDGSLAGYYQFLPVTREYRDEVLAGQARDGRIALEALVPYAPIGEPFHLYLCSMAVRPEYRRCGVAARLYREEGIFQRRLSGKGAELRSLLSVVWSPCGSRFFDRINVPRVGSDMGGRAIRYLELPGGELPEIPMTSPRPEALPQAA
jgi:ribosomal protein S18 acetylase RimI-like enzyme